MILHRKTSLLLLVLAPSLGYADGLTSTLNQTSSQYAARNAYEKCTNEALNGKADGECAGQGGSNGCVGANRAFQNSTKKSKCFIPVKFFCKLFGHEQNDSNTWVSVGSQHLLNASKCINLANDADDIGGQMGGATDFLGNTVGSSVSYAAGDGASNYGLEDGALLKGLQEGKDLASLLKDSPYYKGLSKDEQDAFLEAASNPSLAATDPDYDSSGTTNPAQEALYGEGGASAVAGGGASTDGLDALMLGADGLGAAAGDKDPFADALSKMKDGEAKKRGLASEESALTRKYRSMLDRSIFEMVRSQYQKNMKDLIGMEQFLKRQQKQRPKDIKSIVGSGNKSAKL